jgi:hypothetical protein
MIRLTACAGVLCIIAAAPTRLPAQFRAGAGGFNLNAPYDQWPADPRARRARREQAVAKAGPIARDFVEREGDEAVAAIFACSRAVAVKLAAFYASGGLDKLPRPDALLYAIALPGNGDDVAVWAMRHASELEDPDCFEAYVQSPLEYTCGLKQLAAGAAEARARRLGTLAAGQPQATAAPPITQQEVILVGCGCLILVSLWIWRRRQQQMAL